ncbi:MAG: YceI family protein [Balneolaceae bacterium]
MKTFKKLLLTTLAVGFMTLSSAFTLNNNSDQILSKAWQIDTAHSNISFSITHFFTPVLGAFNNYTADIRFDPNDLVNSSIDVQIDVKSVDTKNQRRDNHLQSEDFFNAERWPHIKFVSNNIRRTGENSFVATGKLTIKDVTKDFELPFRLLGVMDHPMQENTQVAGITAEARLNRTDFGVGVGDWAATMVVGDEVSITLNLELTHKPS